MKKVRGPFSLLLSMLISQATWAFTTSVNTNLLGFVAGRTSGHEEITRQAMNRLEPILVDAGIDIQNILLNFSRIAKPVDLEPRALA